MFLDQKGEGKGKKNYTSGEDETIVREWENVTICCRQNWRMNYWQHVKYFVLPVCEGTIGSLNEVSTGALKIYPYLLDGGQDVYSK